MLLCAWAVHCTYTCVSACAATFFMVHGVTTLSNKSRMSAPKGKGRCPEGLSQPCVLTQSAQASLSQQRERGHPSLQKSNARCPAGAEKNTRSFLPPFLPSLAYRKGSGQGAWDSDAKVFREVASNERCRQRCRGRERTRTIWPVADVRGRTGV